MAALTCALSLASLIFVTHCIAMVFVMRFFSRMACVAGTSSPDGRWSMACWRFASSALRLYSFLTASVLRLPLAGQ